MRFNKKTKTYISVLDLPLFDRALIYIQKFLLPVLPEDIAIDEYDKKQLADIIKLNIENPIKSTLHLICDLAVYFNKWDFEWSGFAFQIFRDNQQIEITRELLRSNKSAENDFIVEIKEFKSPVYLN